MTFTPYFSLMSSNDVETISKTVRPHEVSQRSQTESLGTILSLLVWTMGDLRENQMSRGKNKHNEDGRSLAVNTLHTCTRLHTHSYGHTHTVEERDERTLY